MKYGIDALNTHILVGIKILLLKNAILIHIEVYKLLTLLKKYNLARYKYEAQTVTKIIYNSIETNSHKMLIKLLIVTSTTSIIEFLVLKKFKYLLYHSLSILQLSK